MTDSTKKIREDADRIKVLWMKIGERDFEAQKSAVILNALACIVEQLDELTRAVIANKKEI